MMKSVAKLLENITFEAIKGALEVSVNALVFDSRYVSAHSLFIAIKGTQVDGHLYIANAIEKGAIVIVCETLPENIQKQITYIQVADTAHTLALLAANFYENPSSKLKLVGITGTNGKTTIATLCFQLFTALGYKVGLISTVQNQIGNTIIPATHTTPDPIALNKLLVEMVAIGCEYCFMEVSSHALVQQRIAGLDFTGAAFSNITHDHLDFHQTFANYIAAKKSFFDLLPKNAFALTNIDDKNGPVMLQNTKAHKKTYALKTMANFNAKVLENSFTGLHLNIDQQDVFFKLIGDFNAYNLLCVYGIALLLEQNKNKVLTQLSALSGAEGRFDYIKASNGVIGIIDYAHTPDALQNVLNTIHNIRQGKGQIITIIGCGGDRDKSKRPIMAQVAADWSDKTILTSDNPRTEKPEEILSAMEIGISVVNKKKTISILDRKEAIKTAIHLAQNGDIILLAGKGHEKYQDINGVKHPFDDKQILTDLFNELA